IPRNDQPVGAATSSRPLCRASGPIWVTEIAAIASTMAMQTNTAVMPQLFWMNGMATTMPAVDRRPTPAAQPKPDARALVGNTSDAKICIELPDTWMKNTITKPKISSCVGLPAFAKTIAMMPAPMKEQTAVILRPYLSSAYIMNRLAQGTARFMPRMKVSDLVIVKPRSCIMLGSQLPKPIATPKNAEKQIMPAMTRFGNILKTRAKGSDLVLLAAS